MWTNIKAQILSCIIYTCEEGEVHSLSSPLSSAEREGGGWGGGGGRERIKHRHMKCHVHV